MAVKEDAPARGPQKAHHALAHRGLAAARLSHEPEGLALIDGEAHAVDRLHIADGPAKEAASYGKVHLQVFHFEHHGGPSPARTQQAHLWSGLTTTSGGSSIPAPLDREGAAGVEPAACVWNWSAEGTLPAMV